MGPHTLTDFKTKLEDISYILEDEDGDEEEKEAKLEKTSKPAKAPVKSEKGEKSDKGKGKEKATPPKKDSKRSAVIVESRTRGEEGVSKEQERREKQKELFEKRMEEAKERYSGDGGKKTSAQASVKKVESYKKASDMPVETKSGQARIPMFSDKTRR